jgi:hypothetical protein
MKRIATLVLTLSYFLRALATEQDPDKLLYDNLTLTLNTGWGHPSPLETYFYQNNIAYPFNMLSTANYRGHIATWVIKEDRFYLKDIDIKSKIYSPDKYGIKTKGGSVVDSDLAFADWFSGVIKCYKTDEKDRWKTSSTFYFQVRNGDVISMSEITNKDFKRIDKISGKDTADMELMKKYKLLILNQNYIAYYYRLNENDLISYDGRECRLNNGVSKLSPIYGYYSNQHLNWPFNWENLEKCGAPNCRWKIVNDSLLLTHVQLYRGTRFDSIDKESIELSLLFPGTGANGQVFASWVTGIHLIVYGVDTTYGFGFKEFRPKDFTYCRFEKGMIKEKYTIPGDLDLRKNDDDLAPGLRKLMKEY